MYRRIEESYKRNRNNIWIWLAIISYRLFRNFCSELHGVCFPAIEYWKYLAYQHACCAKVLQKRIWRQGVLKKWKSELCVGNSNIVKIYILRPKPGPVAKNATPRPSGWESNPRPLDNKTSALPLSYRSRCRQLEREFNIYINEMVMPVKYKGILVIIFGIYTRCQ